MNVLDVTSHRPYPKPSGPWLMTQTWSRVFFAHWPMQKELLRPLIPKGLQIDTYEGEAYISIVLFRVQDARVRLFPPIPTTKEYSQVNVRTYVRHKDKCGIWLFSADASSLLSVLGARGFAHLPYFAAKSSVGVRGREIFFRSQRLENPHEGSLRVSYHSEGKPKAAERGTLEDWLTARFCLFTTVGTRLLRGDIHHLPWPPEPVEANIHENSLLDLLPGSFDSNRPFRTHYADRLKTYVWGLSTVGDAGR